MRTESGSRQGDLLAEDRKTPSDVAHGSSEGDSGNGSPEGDRTWLPSDSNGTKASDSNALLLADKIDLKEVKIVNDNHDQRLPLKVNETYQLEVEKDPVNTTDGLAFESRDSEIVEVSETGLLTAKSIGSTYVTVRGVDGRPSDFISVQVTDSEIIEVVFHTTEGLFADGKTDYRILSIAGGSLSIPQPKQEGKLVKAWYKEPEFTNKVTENTYFSPDQDMNLYAEWSNTYNITYNYNGVEYAGKISAVYQIVQGAAIKGEYPYLPSDPNITGEKLFAGWKDEKGQLINNIYNYIPAGDETLTAEWTDEFYTVKLDYSGVTYNDQNFTTRYILEGDSLISTPSLPSDPSQTGGKVLLGWRTPAGEIIANNRVCFYVPSADEVLYAVWSEYYTVTYDPNGGEFPSGRSKVEYVAVGEPVTEAYLNDNVVKREGYLLEGWSVQGTEEVVENGAFIPTSDITLMAKWSEYWTITYDANGGSYAHDSYKSKKVIKGEFAYLNGDYGYERSGYMLEGWCVDSECTGEVLSGDYMPQADITLYAKWSEYVTVTFDAGDGWIYSQHTYSQKLLKGKTIKGIYNTPTMDGGYFEGWYREKEYQNPVGRAYAPSEDEIFYAKWAQDDCWKVTLHGGGPYLQNSEGKTVSDLALTVKKGYSLYNLNYSDRNGYRVSWYLDETYRTPFNINNTIIESDLDLYAKWSEELKIIWQAEGGSDAYGKKSGTLRVAQGENYTSPFPKVSREGFALKGWFTADGREITSQTVFYENMTIHAEWEEGYHIQLDLQGGALYKNGGYRTDFFLKKGEKCDYVPDPVKDDAAFLGWFDGSENKIPYLSSYIPVNDMVITAKWTTDYVKVRFHTDDGVYNPYTDEYVNCMTLNAPKGKAVASSEFYPYSNDRKDGKENGWSLTEDGTQVIDTYGYTFDQETHLYATPQDAWTVCLEYMGGFYNTNVGQNTSNKVVRGKELTYPRAASMHRTGYTFDGWFDNTDYTGTKYSIPFTPEKNITLYAKWIAGELPQYTVSFNTNGGTEIQPQTVTDGQSLAQPGNPSKAGCVFTGWFTDPSCRTSYDFSSVVYKDLTLYAGWTETTDVADAAVTVTGSYVYTGSVVIPELTAKMGTAVLEKDVDYTVSGSSVQAGAAEVTVTGKGGYTGSRTVSFTIEPAETEAVVPTGPMHMTYGTKLSGCALPEGWLWKNGDRVPAAGTCTEEIVLKAADANHKDKTAEITLIVDPASLASAVVTLAEAVVSYNGKAQEPEVTSVELNGNPLSSDSYKVTYEDNIEVGTGHVLVNGAGNYTGTVSAEFTIEKGDPELIIGNKVYGGEYGDTLADITLSEHWTWQNPNTVLEPVTGSGSKEFPADFETYDGCSYDSKKGVMLKVKISPRTLKENEVILGENQFVYNGQSHEPEVTVTVKGKVLTKETDYQVEYQDNVKIGTAKAVVTGKGNYTGAVKKTFRIIADPYDISGASIVLTPNEAPYTGEAIEPLVTVRMLEKVLVNDQDYSFTYQDNINPGAGKVLVTGKGEYHGNKTAVFFIQAENYELHAVYGDKLADVELPEGWSWQDKTLYVGDATEAGRTFKADFSSEDMKRVGVDFLVKVSPKNIGLTEINIDRENIVYEDGKPARPAVTVTDRQLEAVLTVETDYTLAYSDNENAGQAAVTITGKGNYTGTVSDGFTIEQAEAKPGIKAPAKDGVMNLTIKDEPFYLYASHAGDGKITFLSDDASVFTVEKGENDFGDKDDGRITVKGIGEAVLTITVEATKNYKAAELVYRVVVAPVVIGENFVKLEQSSYEYTGEPIYPAVRVTDGTTVLVKEADYTLSYGDNIKAGKDAGSVTVIGIGEYTGSVIMTFDIKKAENPAGVPEATEGIYGQKLKELPLGGGWEWTEPDAVLSSLGGHEFGITLPETENYQEKQGTVIVTVGRYVLNSADFEVGTEAYVYDGKEHKPEVKTVTGFLKAEDYEVSYQNHVNAGTAAILVTGKGNCEGTVEKTFSIEKASAGIQVEAGTAITRYTGSGSFHLGAKAASGETLIYAVSDDRILTVDETGKVTPLRAGTAEITIRCPETDNYFGGEIKVTVTLKSSGSSSGGSSSGGGSSGGSGGSGSGKGSGETQTAGQQSSLPEGFQGETRVIGNVTVPDYVVEGTWEQKEDNTWKLVGQDGVSYSSSWAPVYNPYADTSKGQSAFDWFFFDANGSLTTGWYTDGEKNTFYLNPESDGTRGAMVTGWRLIDGKYYYFNPVSDGTRGKLLKNTTTPDGYKVDENGVWVQ